MHRDRTILIDFDDGAAAGTAHGAAVLFVGVDGVAVDVAVGHQVPAAEHVGATSAGLNAKAGVAAGVVDHLSGAGDESAVFFHTGLDVHARAGANRRRD